MVVSASSLPSAQVAYMFQQAASSWSSANVPVVSTRMATGKSSDISLRMVRASTLVSWSSLFVWTLMEGMPRLTATSMASVNSDRKSASVKSATVSMQGMLSSAFCRCRRVADAYSGFVGVDLPRKMGDSRSYISTPFILVSFATSQNSCHSMPSQFWILKESFIVLYGPPYASS